MSYDTNSKTAREDYWEIGDYRHPFLWSQQIPKNLEMSQDKDGRVQNLDDACQINLMKMMSV